MMTTGEKIKWIWNEWKPHKLYIVLLVFITSLSAGVAVVYPILFRDLIDTLSETLKSTDVENPMAPVYKIIHILIVVGLVKIVASMYPGFRALMNLLFEFLLRQRYFKFILDKDYLFFLKFRTGDLVTRLTADIQEIGWFMCSGIFRAFDSFIKILFCVVAMLYLSKSLTLYALIPIPAMVIAFFIISTKLHRRFKKNQEAISEINNQLEMAFSGIKIIKAYVCEHKYRRFFSTALDDRYKTEFKLVKTQTILHLIYEYIDYFAMITIILVGGYMVVKDDITIGEFYAFYTYLTMLIHPILDLPQLLISGRQAFVCIDRLNEIEEFPSKLEGQGLVDSSAEFLSTSTKIITEINSISFQNVCFSYTDGTELLKNLSFSIRKGEKLLIMGASGSGKTTILGLLSGRLIPTSGDIYINDIPLRSIDIYEFRKLLGYVPQEPSLFTGTITDNVLFGIDSLDFGVEPYTSEYYNDIIGAIQMSEEIDGFSDKHQTKIGQKGLSLSGGQKQRIAIARALFKRPQLLILDDITASLDAKKEDLLWTKIEPMFSNLTAFIVSHRLSSLRYADYILFIEDGMAKAFGKHDVLLLDNTEYRDFIQHHYKVRL
jgi:ATP-binding cassette subfamily B protein